MINYLMITVATILLAGTFTLQNEYQKRVGGSQKVVLLYVLITSLISAVVFCGINGFKIEITPFSFFMAFAMALLCLTYKVIGFEILKLGGMTLFSLFLMTGGMIIPYLWGIAFLDEKFSVLRTIGLVLIFLAVLISKLGEGKKSFKLIALCVAVFVMNGFVSVISKTHQIEQIYPTVSSEGFIILSNISRCFVCGLILIFNTVKGENKEISVRKIVFDKKILLIFALVAIVDGASYLLQLNGAKELPATVLYPFITGGSIIFSAVFDLLIFKVKPTKKLLSSVIICFVGTLLFL